MKKIFNNTGNLIVIILCFFVITAYFGIITFFNTVSDSANDNTGTTAAIYAQNSIEAPTLSKEEKVLSDKYDALKNELKIAQEDASEYLSHNIEIENFIMNQYGEAIQNDYDNYKTYKDKQKAMKEKMSPLFSDEAFKKTLYYDLSTDAEEYTKNVTLNGIEESVTFKNKVVYKRNIFRAFYKNVEHDSANIFLEIYNSNVNQKEYEKLRIEKDENGSFKITDYEIIRQY